MPRPRCQLYWQSDSRGRPAKATHLGSDNTVMPTLRLSSYLVLVVLISGCDALGLPNPAKQAEQAEADAKAVGASCRHSGRALEDCFTLYPNQARAAVYAGWKEMHDYMAAGNIAVVPPTLTKRRGSFEEDDEEEAQDSPPKKQARAGKH